MPANLDNELTRLRIDRNRKGNARRRGGGRVMLALLLVAAAAGGIYVYRRLTAPIPVRVVTPEKEESSPVGGEPVVTASGYVIPRIRIEVAPKIIGRVKEIRIDRGDRVNKGDVLIRIEDDDLKAQLGMAEAQLAAAEAALAEQRTGSRPEEIAVARAAVASAEANLELSRRNLERFRALKEGAVISRQELDQAQMEFDVAQANLKSAKRSAEMVEEGPRKESIQAAEARVRELRSAVEYAKTQLSYTVIEAPTSGTILEKVAELGELVTNTNFGGTRGAKSSIVTMADLSDLQVEIDLNESELGKIARGQPCAIKLDSLPGSVFKGKVDEIAPQADRQKGTVQVKVAILDANDKIRPEVNAQVTFMTGQPASAAAASAPARTRVWISKTALVESPAGPMVYIASSGKAVERRVTPGAEGVKGVEIKDGLAGDESLIVEPLDRMANGKRIQIAP